MGKKKIQYDGGHYSRGPYNKDELRPDSAGKPETTTDILAQLVLLDAAAQSLNSSVLNAHARAHAHVEA